MSRVYSQEAWADGDVISPDDLNTEIGAIVGEMNGHISADNFSGVLLTEAKFALEAFHEILWTETSNSLVVVRENSDTQRWTSILSGTLATEDGRVYVEGQCTYDCPSSAGNHVEIGVRIDGEVVARSGSTNYLESDSPAALGLAPVGPGTHTIEVVMRITPGEYEDAPTSDLSITVNGRSLWARYKAR